MSIELEVFFDIFFQKIITINDNKTSNNILYYEELSSYKSLITNILHEIKNELEKEQINDSYFFLNNICNGFNFIINEVKMSNFVLSNIRMINSFSEKSKEIIIKYLDIILLDNFENDNNFNRTKLYLQKLQHEILFKWKKSYNEYINDINEFNNIIRTYNINFTEYDNISNIICSLNNLDEDCKIKIIDFYEKMIKKYEKYEKINNKISNLKKNKSENNIKPDNIIIEKKDSKKKLNEKDKKEKIPTEKKKKEKIPVSVKNTLWSLNFENSLTGKCQCCKTENISKNNFDCGHIISEKNGGKVELSNLKPICRSCNSSMSTTNMDDFMSKYGFDKIKIKN